MLEKKIGGVYSISSYSNLEKLNFGENYLQIMFSTDTKRVDEVVSKVKILLKIFKGTFQKIKF